jgi:hypothetical protein
LFVYSLEKKGGPELRSPRKKGKCKMKNIRRLALCLVAAAFVCVAQGVVSVVDGTVTKVDYGTKTVVVQTADGTEKPFEYTGTAGKDMGEAVGKGTEKGAQVTVYYTEESGKEDCTLLWILVCCQKDNCVLETAMTTGEKS